jgi:hypothetical protein
LYSLGEQDEEIPTDKYVANRYGCRVPAARPRRRHGEALLRLEVVLSVARLRPAKGRPAEAVELAAHSRLTPAGTGRPRCRRTSEEPLRSVALPSPLVDAVARLQDALSVESQHRYQPTAVMIVVNLMLKTVTPPLRIHRRLEFHLTEVKDR